MAAVRERNRDKIDDRWECNKTSEAVSSSRDEVLLANERLPVLLPQQTRALLWFWNLGNDLRPTLEDILLPRTSSDECFGFVCCVLSIVSFNVPT